MGLVVWLECLLPLAADHKRPILALHHHHVARLVSFTASLRTASIPPLSSEPVWLTRAFRKPLKLPKGSPLWPFRVTCHSSERFDGLLQLPLRLRCLLPCRASTLSRAA